MPLAVKENRSTPKFFINYCRNLKQEKDPRSFQRERKSHIQKDEVKEFHYTRSDKQPEKCFQDGKGKLFQSKIKYPPKLSVKCKDKTKILSVIKYFKICLP